MILWASIWIVLAAMFGIAGVLGLSDFASVGLIAMAMLSVSVELSERRR